MGQAQVSAATKEDKRHAKGRKCMQTLKQWEHEQEIANTMATHSKGAGP